MDRSNEELINKLQKLKKTTQVVTSYGSSRPLNKELSFVLGLMILLIGGLGSWLFGQWAPILGAIFISLLLSIPVYLNSPLREKIVVRLNNREAFKKLVAIELTKIQYQHLDYFPTPIRKTSPNLPSNLEDTFRGITENGTSFIAGQIKSSHTIYYRLLLPFKIEHPILLFKKQNSILKKSGYSLHTPLELTLEYQNRDFHFFIKNKYALNLIDAALIQQITEISKQFAKKNAFEFSFEGNFFHLYIDNPKDFFEINHSLSNKQQVNQVTKQLNAVIEPVEMLANLISPKVETYHKKLSKEEQIQEKNNDGDDTIYDHLIDYE